VVGYVVKGIDFVDYRSTLQSLATYWGNVNERPPGLMKGRLPYADRRPQAAGSRDS
jgi:hypothetical protein